MPERKQVRTRRSRNSGGPSKSRGPRGRYASQWDANRLAPKAYLPGPAYASLDEVPRDIYHRALEEKLPWIQRFLNAGCPRGKLVEFAEAYAIGAGIDLSAVPPYSTLNGWVHRHRAFGLLGLMDAVRGDAGQPRTISADVAEYIRILRVGGKQGAAQILTALSKLCEQDEVPKYHAAYNYVRQFERDNPHLMALADKGIAGFRNSFRRALAGTEYPGGFALALDSTVADIWVRVRDLRSPDGWKAVRLVLTVVSDVGSRLLVSFNLSFKAVDSGILLGTFRRAVYQDANYPGLLATGMPHKVIVDAGAENQGAFKQTLTRHGVEVSASAGYHPERNGREERLIQTIQVQVFGALPGYSKTHERFDAYARAEVEATKRLTDLKYEPYRLELPVTALKTIEEIEAEILGWAWAYNGVSHVGLPVDSPQLMAMVAQAAELDSVEGSA